MENFIPACHRSRGAVYSGSGQLDIHPVGPVVIRPFEGRDDQPDRIHPEGRIPLSECGQLVGLVHQMFASVSEQVQLPTDGWESLVLHAKIYKSSNGQAKAYCEISRMRRGKIFPDILKSGGEMVVALATNINITVEDGVCTKYGDGLPSIVEALQEVQ